MTNKKSKKSARLLRYVLFSLTLLLVLACFISCNGNKGDGTDKAQTDNVEKNNQIAQLLAGNLDAYQVVRSETMDSEELKTVLAFISVIQKNGYSEIGIVNDFVELNPAKETEIIVGDTTRKGSVYNEGEGAVTETDTYSIYIVEKRLIFTYTDSAGLIDGLEYILFSVLDAEQTALSDTYTMALFERGIKRNVTADFTVKNHLTGGSVLSSNEDILFVGTADKDTKVTVQLTKGFDVLSSFDAVAGADRVWQTKVTPDTKADSVLIRVNGNPAERYANLSFKKNEIDNCSEGTKVYINGRQVDVYANKGGNYVISSLAKGETKMEIKLVRQSKVNECTVRPLSAGVEPKTSGKEITFTVTQFPCKLSVEFENFLSDSKQSVQLFLYSYEELTPDLNGRELIYFAPGEYWVNEKINLSSNTTVYLDEGAVLHAKFEVTHADNVTIMGRGIIDTYYFTTETHMAEFENCKNLTLKDYTIAGPRKWMTVLRESKNCVVDALNVLGTEMNSDGIDIVGSQDVTITNCFLRNNDDCIAVKSGSSDVKNVTVKGCIIWNERWGNALEIGFETRCDNISGVTFEDIDILYVNGSCMSIHLGDRAHVKNIKYKDIRIENSKSYLVQFYINTTQYTQDKERGKISDVSIEGIVILGDSFGRISLEGYDATHSISGVSIGKIKFIGRYMTSISNNLDKGSYLYNITYDGKSVL